ncbi:MAG: radical SAM protein [Rhodospirillales bacterium]|jgi:MoaA/NifB/PqqE/SkfB family radical SAM enzyme
MPSGELAKQKPLDPGKFQDPDVTADGQERAVVALTHLRTLWFNTGSLCNITCRNCYMESSPTNDDLAYLTRGEVQTYLDEIRQEALPVDEIAFTGGEPFMNPDILGMIEDALTAGYRVLVLTNAMKPLWHKRAALLCLKHDYEGQLTLRVSIDHHSREKHEDIRGADTWAPMIAGLRWLAEHQFSIAVAGRSCWDEAEDVARLGYSELFTRENIPVDTHNPSAMIIFPEMDSKEDAPEITTSCWEILGVAPETMMCATSRMVVKSKGAEKPVVMPCTLLPYDTTFELGHALADSADTVKLNHPHCSRFCVLGGGSCSPD